MLRGWCSERVEEVCGWGAYLEVSWLVRSLVQPGVSAYARLIYGNEEGRGFEQSVEWGSNKAVENVGSCTVYLGLWAGTSCIGQGCLPERTKSVVDIQDWPTWFMAGLLCGWSRERIVCLWEPIERECSLLFLLVFINSES